MIETGVHVAFGCFEGEKWGRAWSSWVEMDDKRRWNNSCKSIIMLSPFLFV